MNRWLWLIILYAVFVGFPFNAAMAEIYRIDYLNRTYTEEEFPDLQTKDHSSQDQACELLVLEIKGRNAEGRCFPLLGYRSAGIRVTGNNSSEGVLDLTFHFARRLEQFSFDKSVTDTKIVWTAVNDRNLPEGERDISSRFYRNRIGTLSEAQMTLTYSECGPHYGTIGGLLREGLTVEQIALVKTDPSLRNITYSVVDSESGQNVNHNLLDFIPNGEEASTFNVPIGTEVTLVRKLRETGLFQNFDLDGGGCGGADRTYFTVARSNFFEGPMFSDEKFTDYLMNGLKVVLSGEGSYKFFIGKPHLEKVRIPPFPLSVSVDVRAASEITRGTEGFWDQFTVYFEPFENATKDANKYSVVTWIERLASTRRSAGSDSPPDESFFQALAERHNEAIATTSISAGLSKDGTCIYEEEGFLEDMQDRAKADAISRKMKCGEIDE